MNFLFNEVQERMRAASLEYAHSTPDEFGRLIARDIATWSKVVKAGNIKIDWCERLLPLNRWRLRR